MMIYQCDKVPLFVSDKMFKENIIVKQNADIIVINKGQPLQELIEYLTEVNKDFKPKENES